jgi:hypothetical protein
MATPPDFTAGQVLTAAQMNAVGLWLVKTQTIGTAVASVTVTDAFSTDYDHYKITISDGVSSLSTIINFQLGASTTGYYNSRPLAAYVNGTYLGGNTSNGAAWSGVGVSSASGIGLNMELINPALATRTFFSAPYMAPITNDYGGVSSGFHNVATAYTSFIIAPAGGTLTGGTIRIYGFRK